MASKPQENVPQFTVISDLKNLLGSAGKGVDGGKVGNTAELLGKLDSLQQNYATAARYVLCRWRHIIDNADMDLYQYSSRDYTEPADLTETQWENILFNNRILHGYTHMPGTGLLVKAPKRGMLILLIAGIQFQANNRSLLNPSSAPGTFSRSGRSSESPSARGKGTRQDERQEGGEGISGLSNSHLIATHR